MEMRRDVFQAIADPTRRQILQLLTDQQMNVRTLATHFQISRPAISKHIKILSECGLVMTTTQGRESICAAQPQGLQEVAEWVAPFRVFWNRKLDALENFLSESSSSKNTSDHEK